MFQFAARGKYSLASLQGISQNVDSLYIQGGLSSDLRRSNRIVSPRLWPLGEKATGVGKLMRFSFSWNDKIGLLKEYSTLKLTLLANFVFSLFFKLKPY